MSEFRFSPIKSKEELLRAIEYTHARCAALCKEKFGSYLPVAGNIGIFCHFQDEYEFLTKLREEMTDSSNHWNKKYYLLHHPIVLPEGDVPGATYTHLYIRKPDEKYQVGDVDYVLEKQKYVELKQSLKEGKIIEGIQILNRPDLDLISISDKEFDVLSFIGSETILESIRTQNML